MLFEKNMHNFMMLDIQRFLIQTWKPNILGLSSQQSLAGYFLKVSERSSPFCGGIVHYIMSSLSYILMFSFI